MNADVIERMAAVGASWLLTHALHGTVLLGLAWAAIRVGLIRRPLSRELAWRVALLGGLVTATGALLARGGSSELAWSVETMPGEERPAALHPRAEAMGAEPARAETIRAGELVESRELTVRVQARVAEATPACREAVRALGREGLNAARDRETLRSACPARAGARWYHALVLVWALGVLVHGARGVVRWSRLRELRGSFEPPDPHVARILDTLCDEAGLRGARLRTSRLVSTPCVVGRRTVVLPERAHELDRPELRAVLAHELAHVARGDVLWLEVMAAARALVWLHPLAAVGLRGARDAAEHACDDWALGRAAEPWGLARSIERVATWCLEDRRRAVGVPMVGGPPGATARRVERILLGGTDQGSARWRGLLLGAALLAPGSALPAVPLPADEGAVVVVERSATARAGPSERAADVELDHRVRIVRFEGIDVRRADARF